MHASDKSTGVGTRPETNAEAQKFDSLLDRSEADRFQSRWQNIQARFVDDPQQSVDDADDLVAELTDELQQLFAAERSRLEQRWNAGEETSTEDLRVALTRYRAFFNRLLST